MASLSYTRVSEFAKAIGLVPNNDKTFIGFVNATANLGFLRKEGTEWHLSQEYNLGSEWSDIITLDNIDNMERFLSAPGGIY